jgi:nicotinamide-nucleotide adenylyltransferase
MKLLFIGRFQPFHKGHLKLIRTILGKDDKLVIGIGSSQYSFTEDNPFTSSERREMIASSLTATDIKNFNIVDILDLHSNARWSSLIGKLIPDFDAAYTNNPLVKSLLSDRGHTVRTVGLFGRKELSGTSIRRKMREAGAWTNLVTKETCRVINKLDGVNRIKSIHAQKSQRIFTIGHSTRPINEFIALLKEYYIDRLVDVRSIPRSLHNPQFEQSALTNSLSGAGIRYVHIKGLGGLRPSQKDSINLGWRNSSFRGFADYMKEAGFYHGMSRLLFLSKKTRVAIMCGEAVPWRCHRSLISDALIIRRIPVTHILDHNQTREHSLTSFAVVKGNRITYPTS